MKRISITLLVVLLVYACAAVAQGITLRDGQSVTYKFQPMFFDFNEPDKVKIEVWIDPHGTMTVLENGTMRGQRYDVCVLVAD